MIYIRCFGLRLLFSILQTNRFLFTVLWTILHHGSVHRTRPGSPVQARHNRYAIAQPVVASHRGPPAQAGRRASPCSQKGRGSSPGQSHGDLRVCCYRWTVFGYHANNQGPTSTSGKPDESIRWSSRTTALSVMKQRVLCCNAAKTSRIYDQVGRDPVDIHTYIYTSSLLVVDRISTGDRVAVEPGVPCEKCFLCDDGRYNLCEDVQFAGVYPYNGTIQRYKVHPAKYLHKYSSPSRILSRREV